MDAAFYINLGIYILFIIILCVGFHKVKLFESEITDAKTRFSIIIPFRNEAENLPQLLQSLALIDYPIHLFELCFVNDASKDRSVEIINNFKKECALNISITNNQRSTQSPKKDAITTAINQSNFEWIVTTDADCLLPTNWLSILNSFILSNEVDFIASAVAYRTNTSFFENFQALDFLSLQAITIGAFGIDKAFMCNGANLAYKRLVFKEINGFEGNSNMASGDDVFLLQKVIQQKKFNVNYLKSKAHIVETFPVNNLKDLFSQRIRWASKTKAYRGYFPKFLALSVFLVNLSLVISLPFLAFGILKIETIIFIWIGKLLIDALPLYQTAQFMRQTQAFKYYALSAIIYPFFVVISALTSFFKTFEWKERTFNN
ncbi:glycosyltransferase [Paucihalobacter ruber]|uniref:Glycosyltransferase n=1 Tax=Paucihalobacter ruber TaxID=2567861 RepID=A0A506PD71_9FLAO|nr:glycosyltransferase [Paucihalobacter ruber]TPV31803.1 glycosyltransferase [Paucihalobacter ruber]